MSRALNALGRWKPGRTFAQSLAALLGANGIGLADVDWAAALSVSGMAGLLSALFIARAEARDRREHDTDHDL